MIVPKNNNIITVHAGKDRQAALQANNIDFIAMKVPCFTVNTIMKMYEERCSPDALADSPSLPPSIDYLNIDAEGEEHNILLGIDFSSILPATISVEIHAKSTRAALESTVCSKLEENGYIHAASSVITHIFYHPTKIFKSSLY